MRTTKSIVCTILCLVVICFAVESAAAAGAGLARSSPFFSGPKSETTDFLLTEFSLTNRMARHRSYELGVQHATFDLGVMRNVGRRTAVGATMHLATDDQFDHASFLGFQPRLRVWLGRRWRIDLAAGANFLALNADHRDFEFPGLIGQLSVGYADWISLVLQLERTEYSYASSWQGLTQRTTSICAGAAIGSYPGLAVGAMFAAVALFGG